MAQPGSPDHKLIQKAVQGNRKAFTELFNRYFQALYNYALTLSHDPAQAEDITQEAFIRAHNNLHRLGPPWNFHAWLFRLARNYFIDLTRKDRDHDQLEEERQVISTGPSPERETLSREVSDRVHSTLARLSGWQREILTLRELQGFSYAEIGEIMDLSDSNVKVSLHRARAAFQDSYGISLLLADPRGDCQEVTELLNALHDGEALLDRERFVKEHLKVCESCQKRREQLIKQSAILGAFIPIIPPRELAGKILEALNLPAPAPALSKGGRIKRFLGYGGAAAAMGVTGIMAYFILFNPDGILPNFPGFTGGSSTPAALSALPPEDPGVPTPTPQEMEAYSGPVPPAARCGVFKDLEVGAVFLNIREDTMTLPVYFRFMGDVPGFSAGQPAEPEPWLYEGRLGDVLSSRCSLQGFDNRLYCLFKIPETWAGTYQELALHLKGCEGPVVYYPRLSIPAFVVPAEAAPVCNASLDRPACEEVGGMYFTFSAAAYCVCP